MGTSASNSGPKGSPPLLPPWYNDEGAPASPNSEPPNTDASSKTPALPDFSAKDLISKNWGSAKGALTRMSNNTGGSSYKKAARKYVSSMGGAKSATRGAVLGIITASSYASFLGSLSIKGYEESLIGLGLAALIGKSTEEICTAIANALAPVGSTNDEAIAREAMISTLDILYTRILENGNDITALENLSAELIKETLIEYVSSFVFTKWMYELGSSIEKGNVTEREAIDLEISVKDLIYTETVEKYRDIQIEVTTLESASTTQVIENIFSTAYSLLES